MKRASIILAPLAAMVIAFAGCSTVPPDEAAPRSTTPAESSSKSQPPSSTAAQSLPAKPKTLTVPSDLADTKLGEAKERLAQLGFTDVVVAGGAVTDNDPVASVPNAGQDVSPDAKIVLIGTPSTPQEQQKPDTRADPSGADTTFGCGQRAVRAGEFNPSCSEYQGYLDPGTIAGRGPTSGEKQFQHGCEQGYIPREQCAALPN